MPERESSVKREAMRTRMLTNMAMMLTIMITLTTLEHMLPPIPIAPPGVKLGLSNIVTMYTLFFLGRRQALILAVLKSVFVLMMRGATAGILSLSGGIISVLLIILLILILRSKATYLILSIAGAIAHNFAQIVMASLILSTNILVLYWPILLLSGVIMGTITGSLLKVVMPYMDKVFRKKR